MRRNCSQLIYIFSQFSCVCVSPLICLLTHYEVLSLAFFLLHIIRFCIWPLKLHMRVFPAQRPQTWLVICYRWKWSMRIVMAQQALLSITVLVVVKWNKRSINQYFFPVLTWVEVNILNIGKQYFVAQTSWRIDSLMHVLFSRWTAFFCSLSSILARYSYFSISLACNALPWYTFRGSWWYWLPVILGYNSSPNKGSI